MTNLQIHEINIPPLKSIINKKKNKNNHCAFIISIIYFLATIYYFKIYYNNLKHDILLKNNTWLIDAYKMCLGAIYKSKRP